LREEEEEGAASAKRVKAEAMLRVKRTMGCVNFMKCGGD
jgi:hypothetical protein